MLGDRRWLAISNRPGHVRYMLPNRLTRLGSGVKRRGGELHQVIASYSENHLVTGALKRREPHAITLSEVL